MNNEPHRTSPLAGRRVLVTRATSQASDLVASLEEAGAIVEHFPAIDIVGPPSWESLDAVLDDPVAWRWLIFTSTNGVDSFFARLETRGVSAAAFEGARVAAVGQSTADSLRARGVMPDIVPRKFQASEILPLMPADLHDTRMAIIRALEGRDTLPDALRARGADVHLAIAYETRKAPSIPEPLRSKLVAGDFDAITFTSPSTVQGLLGHLRSEELESAIRRTVMASIGPVTTKALERIGAGNVIEAREASVAGLCDALATRLA